MMAALVLGLAMLAVAGVSATAYADGNHTHPTKTPIPYHNMTISYEIEITAALNNAVANNTFPDGYVHILDRAVYDGLQAWADLNPNIKILNGTMANGTTANYTTADYTISVLIEPYDPNEGVGWGYTGGLYGNDHYAHMGVEAHTYDCIGQPAWYWSESLRNTVAHEFGHLLGFGHNLNQTHLMYGDTPSESLPGVDIYTVPEDLGYGGVFGYSSLVYQYDNLIIILERSEDQLDQLEAQLNSVPGSTLGPDGTLYLVDPGAYGYYQSIYEIYETTYETYTYYHDYITHLVDQMNCLTTPLVPPDTTVDGGVQ